MARFAILSTGVWDVNRNSIITPESAEVAAENRRHTIPGFFVLVQDEKVGNILFDTGIAPDWDTTWPEPFRTEFSDFRVLETMDEQLKNMGLSVDDIDQIVLSHLHYDHCGNVKLFAHKKGGQKIITSTAEAHEAFVLSACSPDGVSGAYYRPEFIMDGIGYELIDEDIDLSDKVHLFLQPGHTPCVVGMIVETAQSGNYIFPSDACYSAHNFGPPCVLPGLCVDAEGFKKSVEHLRELKEEYNAVAVAFSHDVEDFKQWKVGQWYE